MRILSRTTFIFLYVLVCSIARGDDSVLTVQGISPSGSIRSGVSTVLTVELNIHSPYHINSHTPLEDYIPTTLEIPTVEGLELSNIRYPVATMKTFPFSGAPLSVYEGKVKILIDVTPGADLDGRDVTLRGNVRYQACNDTTCLPPASQPFAIAMSVVGTSEENRSDVAPVPASPKPGGDSAESPGRTESASDGLESIDLAGKSLPVLVPMVFLFGLALSLTPCVYPMIPITITYFGGQAQGKKGSLVLHACLYVIGMAVTYSILGVAAALTGGLLGSALRYPPVLIGIALVMVLLALSMFEVYELRMPAFLNRLAGGNRSGFAGTVLMGMTVGIVAAPCIGPFVLALLTYVGNRGDAFVGFLLFFVLSLGMGTPLLILGIFSGSIHRLPRSGEWMIWVRKVFGFILLAMAVFFLRTLLPPPLTYPLALAMLLALAGIYLAWIAPVSGGGKGFAWLRNIVGMGFFIASLYVAVTGVQAYVEDYTGRNVPGGNVLAVGESVQWLPYSENLLESGAQANRPVLIDFYADWCVYCKELDRHTFSDPEIIELSKQFIMIKVDLTVAGDPEGEALQKRYQVPGLPTLVFLRPDGSEIEDLRVTRFEPPDIFLPKMTKAYRDSMSNAAVPASETDPGPSPDKS